MEFSSADLLHCLKTASKHKKNDQFWVNFREVEFESSRLGCLPG